MKKGKGLLCSVALALTLFTSCSENEAIDQVAESQDGLVAAAKVETLKENYGLKDDFLVAPIEKVILNNQTYQLDNLTKPEFATLENAFITNNKIFLDEIGSIYLTEQEADAELLQSVYKQYLGDDIIEVEDGIDAATGRRKVKKFQVARATLQMFAFNNYKTRGAVFDTDSNRTNFFITIPTLSYTLQAGRTVKNYRRSARSTVSPIIGPITKKRFIRDMSSARAFVWNGDQNVFLRYQGYSQKSYKGSKIIDEDQAYNIKVVNRNWKIHSNVLSNKTSTGVESMHFDLTVTSNRK